MSIIEEWHAGSDNLAKQLNKLDDVVKNDRKANKPFIKTWLVEGKAKSLNPKFNC
jgi:hypothetical protein